MAKRKPGTELNHDNWDQEEEPDEAGEFQKASDEALKGRKILRPKRRRGQPGTPPDSAPPNPFASIKGFNITTPSNNNPFAGFKFQVASSSSDTVAPAPTNSTPADANIHEPVVNEVAPNSHVSTGNDIAGAVGESTSTTSSTTQAPNVEPEKFSFATGLPFNSNKKTDFRVTTTGSDSASGNEISTSSESASCPPSSLEPDSTYEARDNAPCGSDKGVDEESISVDNDVSSDKSNINNATDGTGGLEVNHECLHNEPDSTEN